jgi:hypothetical protein
MFSTVRHWSISSPYLPPYLPKIHPNTNFPSTPCSCEWSLPFKFSNQNIICVYLSYAFYMPFPSNILDLIILIVFGGAYNLRRSVIFNCSLKFGVNCFRTILVLSDFTVFFYDWPRMWRYEAKEWHRCHWTGRCGVVVTISGIVSDICYRDLGFPQFFQASSCSTWPLLVIFCLNAKDIGAQSNNIMGSELFLFHRSLQESVI